MNERIIIVGGGIIGLALAWRLSQNGVAVTVIDAGAAVPPATPAAAGMLAPSFEELAGPISGALYDFSVASLKRWRSFAAELEAESGEAIDYRPFGILGVAMDESGAAALREAFEAVTALGGAVEWLTGDETRAIEAGLSDRVLAGVFAREEGQVDPRRATRALREAVSRRGGAFINARIRRIVRRGADAIGVETAGGDRIEGVRVVIAAGAAAAAIELGAAAPVYPIKGEAVALRARGDNLRCVVRAPGAYLCPKADGRLVIGATEVEEDASLEPAPAAIEGLKRAGAAVFPASGAYREVERWAGLRPATPDAAPILGPVPDGPEGLFLALGHYRNGILLAPETAAALAPAILGGEISPLLGAFSLARFKN